MAKKPSVGLTLDKDAFNLLLAVLEKNMDNPDFSHYTTLRASALYGKLIDYAKPYINEENGMLCAEIWFYPSEASYLMGQLIRACDGNFAVLKDPYSLLLERKYEIDE